MKYDALEVRDAQEILQLSDTGHNYQAAGRPFTNPSFT